jgi:hypothetical protein
MIKNKIKTGISFSTAFVIASTLFTSCDKIDDLKKYNQGNSANKSTYTIRMTDAPGDYNQVNIEIDSVIVKTDKGNVVTMNVQKGIYNLLDFQNGVDTMIAQASLDSCTISQIRLVLGSQNTVMVDSVVYPLVTPSAQNSGLKIQVHHMINQGVDFIVLLDFDAKKSVIKTGNGKYMLKPVIHSLK